MEVGSSGGVDEKRMGGGGRGGWPGVPILG